MRSQSSDHHEKQIIKQLKKSNYYEILDLKSGATDRQIKKSFKKMALKYHPDKNSASSSKQVFHKISQAYDTLSDPSKRLIYDEKQTKASKNKGQFNFTRPKSNSENPFNSYQFYNDVFKRAYQFQAKYAQKQTQFKMYEKARKERQQREKERKKQWNQFFKTQTDFKNSKQPDLKNSNQSKSFSASQHNQKTSWQNVFNNFTRQKDFFYFQRPNNKTNFFTKDYQQKRREAERKQRLLKQKQRADKNIMTFMAFILIIFAWLFFSYFGSAMKGIPVYSMQPSENYKIVKFTKELNSPFYVTQQYVERTSSDDKFREYLDRKIDFVYIKTLSRVCNTMKIKEQEIIENLEIVKSKKSRKQLNQQLKALDLSACDKLHNARQLNPVYFKELFSDPRNREQL